jgi:hypothetical protein
MDWVGRLGRIGGFAAAAAATGAAACGRTVMPAPEAAPRVALCLAAANPAGTIAITIAGPVDSTGLGDPAAGLPALLNEIATALPLGACAARPPAGRSDASPASGDTVMVHRVREADARDAIDQGADVLVTRDRPVAVYALARPGLAVVSLPWDRTYVLVVHRPPTLPDSDADPLRAALATDALRADARPLSAREGLPAARVCDGDLAHRAVLGGIRFAGQGRNTDTEHVIYDEADSTARFLAERLAVLASTRSKLLAGVAGTLDPAGTEMSVKGIPSGDVSRALLDGSSAAYVVSIPSDTSLVCSGPSSQSADSPAPGTATRDQYLGIIPLIQTRAAAIVRVDAVARIAGAAASAGVVMVGGRAP